MTRSSPARPKKLALCRERIPRDSLARLRALATIQNRPLAAVLNDALRSYERVLKARKR